MLKIFVYLNLCWAYKSLTPNTEVTSEDSDELAKLLSLTTAFYHTQRLFKYIYIFKAIL